MHWSLHGDITQQPLQLDAKCSMPCCEQLHHRKTSGTRPQRSPLSFLQAYTLPILPCTGVKVDLNPGPGPPLHGSAYPLELPSHPHCFSSLAYYPCHSRYAHGFVMLIAHSGSIWSGICLPVCINFMNLCYPGSTSL